MTTKQKKQIQKKIKALNRLTGMFKVNGANRKVKAKGFRFVLKNY